MPLIAGGPCKGFIGTMLILAILLVIIIRAFMNAKRARDELGAYICYGMFALIACQTIINIGMVIGMLPVIGITLPFFSAGGSSTLCLYIGIGLVFSIYRYNRSRETVNFRLSRIASPFSEY